MERGEGEGKKIGDSKEGWRSGVTRGHDRNRNSVHGRGAEGRARETVLLLVFICGATEISALQLTRTISGGRYFNGSQRLRAYTVQCAPMCFATGFSPLSNVRHKCIFYLRIYSFASSFFFPPFSPVEIVSSFSFPRFRFRFLQRGKMRIVRIGD